jgi:hypothetical protein
LVVEITNLVLDKVILVPSIAISMPGKISMFLA